MTHHYKKFDFPVDDVRRFLEPGPVVLVSSAWKADTNIMTMGWHMMMGFSPSLIGCYIWTEDHSYDMIRHSKECVINIPTSDMADTVVGIGNSTGAKIDKFKTFGLTAIPGTKVNAPLIKECYANIECRLYETRLIKSYSLFIFEAVKAHAPKSSKEPSTLHYRGDGKFMVSGKSLNLRKKFKPEML